MALRIVKPDQPITVKQIVTVIYAAPGLRKSSLAFTADAPLLLDFDHGVHRAFGRKDSVTVETWKDAEFTADELKPYKTLIFDTAGRALDVLSVQLIAENPKNGRGGGALSLPGYGELKSRFTAYLNLARASGLDVVLLVHMDEQRRGDELIERLDVQGGSKNEIYKSADAMGRLSVRNKHYYLNFSPTETAFGKNPGGFDELEVPRFEDAPRFLADIIEKTKAALNRQTEAQAGAAKELAEWQAKFDKADNPAELNAFVPLLADAGDNVKRLLLSVGTKKGYEWSKEAKGFKEPPKVEAEPEKEAEQDEIQWPEPEKVPA